MTQTIVKKKKLLDGTEVSEQIFQEAINNSDVRLKIISETDDTIEYKTLTKLEG